MFWNRFVELCNSINKKPNPVASDLGISSGAVNKWKNGAIPHDTTLMKIADYFGVSVNYLLGKETTINTNTPDAEHNGRVDELEKLFAQLTAEQQSLVISQIKGIIQNQTITDVTPKYSIKRTNILDDDIRYAADEQDKFERKTIRGKRRIKGTENNND